MIVRLQRAAFTTLLVELSPASQAQDATPTASAIQDFLLASRAADFAANEQKRPVKVKGVQLQYSKKENGDKVFMLCGKFRPKNQDKALRWTEFATLKTGGYEQWLVSQAGAICKDASPVFAASKDLSAQLEARLKIEPNPST